MFFVPLYSFYQHASTTLADKSVLSLGQTRFAIYASKRLGTHECDGETLHGTSRAARVGESDNNVTAVEDTRAAW